MGRAIVEAVPTGAFSIVAQINPGDDPARIIDACDVVIDFSSPGATVPLARLAADHRKPVVIGTTGHSDAEKTAIREQAARVPIVQAGNFSVGVNLLFHLTQRAAEILGPGYDAEITEMHHRLKKDAPSGTADRLLEILLEARSLRREQVRHGRKGLIGARPEAEIGVHALRGGDVVGDHTVIFAGPGERLELKHQAGNRAVFAEGALRAAAWAVEQAPGFYDMQDVLGLRHHV